MGDVIDLYEKTSIDEILEQIKEWGPNEIVVVGKDQEDYGVLSNCASEEALWLITSAIHKMMQIE